MTEEMLLLMLRRAKDAYRKATIKCPFCQLAMLRKKRDNGSMRVMCDYCEFEHSDCVLFGEAKLLELQEKFKNSEWAR